jgi:hypothetical protein
MYYFLYQLENQKGWKERMIGGRVCCWKTKKERTLVFFNFFFLYFFYKKRPMNLLDGQRAHVVCLFDAWRVYM